MWVDVRNPRNTKQILFRYDPARDIIEMLVRGYYTIDGRTPLVIDLLDYKRAEMAGTINPQEPVDNERAN